MICIVRLFYGFCNCFMPRWTPESRERQRQAIQNWSPWASSTGPTTAEGKAKASRNAILSPRRKWARECIRECDKWNQKDGCQSELIIRRGRVIGYRCFQRLGFAVESKSYVKRFFRDGSSTLTEEYRFMNSI